MVGRMRAACAPCPAANAAGSPPPTSLSVAATDVGGRCALAGVRATASAGTATALLAELPARMPVPVPAIRVDGGSAFVAGGGTACRERGIARSVLPPRSPKLNGRAAPPNGTARRERRACDEGGLASPALHAALPAWARPTRLSDPTKRSGTTPPPPPSPPSRPHMYRSSTDVAILLSRRELDVLRLLAAGLSDRAIAEALFIGERTVNTHVARTFAKLGVRNRAAAVTAAAAAGLIDRPVPPVDPA